MTPSGDAVAMGFFGKVENGHKRASDNARNEGDWKEAKRGRSRRDRRCRMFIRIPAAFGTERRSA